MIWQVRHKVAGVFMGVSHGKAHFHVMSGCCRHLGVFRFARQEQIEVFIEMANSPHLPESARLQRQDFVVEEWNVGLNGMLLDEALLDDCYAFLRWSSEVFPIGFN